MEMTSEKETYEGIIREPVCPSGIISTKQNIKICQMIGLLTLQILEYGWGRHCLTDGAREEGTASRDRDP